MRYAQWSVDSHLWNAIPCRSSKSVVHHWPAWPSEIPGKVPLYSHSTAADPNHILFPMQSAYIHPHFYSWSIAVPRKSNTFYLLQAGQYFCVHGAGMAREAIACKLLCGLTKRNNQEEAFQHRGVELNGGDGFQSLELMGSGV